MATKIKQCPTCGMQCYEENGIGKVTDREFLDAAAIAAMQGLLNAFVSSDQITHQKNYLEETAEIAFDLAEALLAERKRRMEKQ